METAGRAVPRHQAATADARHEAWHINRLIERARQVDPSYEPGHFSGYFIVETDSSLDLRGLLKELLSWPSVKAAYLDIPAPDPLVNAADDPRSPNQGYLDPSPDGIDAEYAWGFTGGDGAGQQVIDLSAVRPRTTKT